MVTLTVMSEGRGTEKTGTTTVQVPDSIGPGMKLCSSLRGAEEERGPLLAEDAAEARRLVVRPALVEQSDPDLGVGVGLRHGDVYAGDPRRNVERQVHVGP